MKNSDIFGEAWAKREECSSGFVCKEMVKDIEHAKKYIHFVYLYD